MTIINTINGKYDTEKGCLTHEEYRKPMVKVKDAGKGSAESSLEVETVPQPAGTESKTDVAESALQSEAIPVADSGSSVVKQQVPSIHIHADGLTSKPEHQLPTDYLMPEIREVADTLAKVMNCSEDIVISTMFAVVSGAVGSKVSVTDGIYTNRLNINVCHVAPPGSNKTQPVSVLSEPLQLISEELYMQYKRDKKACEDNKDFENMPKPQILYATNPTPEALNKYLAYNPRGIFARRDELSGFIDDLMGRYNTGGGVPDFLSTFTNESISILRSQDEPLVVKHPYLTVIGGIQPGIVADAFGNSKLIKSGFNYRWLFCNPKIKISLERPQDPLPTAAIDYWEMLIRRYFNMSPMKLTLDKDALHQLNVYYRKVAQKTMDGDSDYANEVRSKLLIYIEKWAALSTLMHGENIDYFYGMPKEKMGCWFTGGVPCRPVVTGEAMEYSIRCMDVFEEWAMQVYTMSQEKNANKGITLAQAICKIDQVHPITDKRKFAESCNMSREFVYKCLNKKHDKNEKNNDKFQNNDSELRNVMQQNRSVM
jgi:hypothetical protein